MSKPDVLQRIKSEKVIALIRADQPAALLECARALSAGGLTCLELTMTTPLAIELCARVAQELPGVLLGLGTVLDADTARAGIAAGAKFIVTPALRPAVIAACRAAGVPVLSGALTPAEVAQGWELGADLIKVFPAELYGPAYVQALKAQFPPIEFVPTGGVTPATIGEFLRGGAFATAAGSTLVSAAALQSGDWPAITARAREFTAAAHQV